MDRQGLDIDSLEAVAKGGPMGAPVPALEDSGVGGSSIEGGGSGRIDGQGRAVPPKGPSEVHSLMPARREPVEDKAMMKTAAAAKAEGELASTG